MNEKSEALQRVEELQAWALNAAVKLRRLNEEVETNGTIIQYHEASIARLTSQRDALLEAIKPMIDLAEFWINHGQKEHMSEQEFKVWLALGHESDAMRNARAAIKAVEENT